MKRLFPLLLCWTVLASVSAETVPVTVLGDRVNLRNAASTAESDVVSQANYGDTLRAVSFTEDWVEVRPPAGFPTWVYSDHLFEGKEVRNPVLNVRAGPGVNYPVVGKLERGDEVDVEEVVEDWSRIAPPDGVTLWISRRFVQAPPSVDTRETTAVAPEPTPTQEATPTPEAAVAVMPGPTPVPTPAPTPETVVEVRTVERVVEVQVTPTPVPTVTPPEDLNLVPLNGQGAMSLRRGKLKAFLLAGTSPSRFVLMDVDADGGEGKTLAYLRGDEEELKPHIGKFVKVRGRDFWVSGRRLPVTEVEAITLVGETP